MLTDSLTSPHQPTQVQLHFFPFLLYPSFFLTSFFLVVHLLLQYTDTVDFSFNPLADSRFVFHDHSLVEAVKLENTEVHAFFRLLALCHTVMAEEKKEGEDGTDVSVSS